MPISYPLTHIARLPREITQICGGVHDQYGRPTMYALCNDGTVWSFASEKIPYGMTDEYKKPDLWTRLPNIPERKNDGTE